MPQVLPIIAKPHIRSFGKLLLDGGLVNRASLNKALGKQRVSGAPLGEILTGMDCLSTMERDAVLLLQTQIDEGRIHIECDASSCRVDNLHLGELLVDHHLIDQQTLDSSLEQSHRERRRLGEVLVDRHLIAQKTLTSWLKLQRHLIAAAAMALLSIHSGLAQASPPESLSELGDPLRTELPAPEAGARDGVNDFIASQKLRSGAPHFDGSKRAIPDALGLRPFQIAHLRRLSPVVLANAVRFDLSAGLVMAVIHTESAFNVRAQSAAKAVGLMQIVPRTAGVSVSEAIRGDRSAPTNRELMNAETNIEFGSAYLSLLKYQYLKFIQNVEVREVAAIAAYNWGPTRIRSLLRRKGIPETAEAMEALINNHAPRETRHYVKRVRDRRALYTAYFAQTSKIRIASIQS